MVMTSVLGHVKELDFHPEYGNWSITPPDSLFEAEIQTKVADVREFQFVVGFNFVGQKEYCSKFTNSSETISDACNLD